MSKNLEVAKQIQTRLNSEIACNIPQKAEGRAEILIGYETKQLWIIRNEIRSGASLITGITGGIIGTKEGSQTILKSGTVISRNSPIGNAIAEVGGLGEGEYIKADKTTSVNFKINSFAKYLLDVHNQDAKQGIIQSIDDDEIRFEESLNKLLIDLSHQIADLEKERESATKAKQAEIDERIQKLKIELGSANTKASRYRRTSISIRQQFLLDPEQNKVKRSKLFNGPLIINGGPGTGKTTSLIHRVQYLLDKELENDPNLKVKLNNTDKEFIRNQKSGWIFFSPTVLLQRYLADAMTADGLEANSETVRVWEDHRTTLTQAFGLFNTLSGKPFQNYQDNKALFDLNFGKLTNLISSFETHFLLFISKKTEKASQLNLDNYSWNIKGINIQKELEAALKTNTLNGLILAINKLSQEYKELRILIEKNYNSLISDVANGIQAKLSSSDLEWFKSELKNRKAKLSINEVDDDDEDENDELEESFEEEIIDGKRFDLDLNKIIKRLIRNDALKARDKSTKVSKKDLPLLQRINPYINKNKYSQVAELAIFNKYFKPILKGADSFILKATPRVYKDFRKNNIQFNDYIDSPTKERVLNIINANPKNTRIHKDEQDFLILVYLRLARLFVLITASLFNTSDNIVLATYRKMMKAMVAIDEATDFTPIQLACMSNISHPRYDCVTMCGDIMQQMNDLGLKDWEDFKTLFKSTEIKHLYKSYRQTPTLLKLASKLYKARFGKAPEYVPVNNDFEHDPKPLIYKNSDFESKINWVANRIGELYMIYENVIPNIAVFVKNEVLVTSVTEALNRNYSLLDHNIQAIACREGRDIGSAEKIRVFNISYIKGMEFEAVFFLDVDTFTSEDTSILDKLIYVGVSRATYYLAITINEQFPKLLNPIKNDLIEGSWLINDTDDY